MQVNETIISDQDDVSEVSDVDESRSYITWMYRLFKGQATLNLNEATFL